jgi:alkylhydroperoxidase/carboxymuconolactone decarboxylase family protein YurZ
MHNGVGDFAASTTLVWVAFATGGETRTCACFTRPARTSFATTPIEFVPALWPAVAKAFAKVTHLDTRTRILIALSFALARGVLRPHGVSLLSHFKPTLNRRMFRTLDAFEETLRLIRAFALFPVGVDDILHLFVVSDIGAFGNHGQVVHLSTDIGASTTSSEK